MNERNDILIELQYISPYLASMEKKNPFTVPAGYFEQSEDNILEKTIYQPSFNYLSSNNSLSVPQGYFDNLSTNILDKIKSQAGQQSAFEEIHSLSPLLVSVDKNQVYEIPAGYFESLSSNILNKLQSDSIEQTSSDEIRSLSPMLYAIQNEQVYQLPAGYFKTLSDVIVNKVSPAEPAKVVSFKKRSIWQLAAAAVVTGAIAISTLLISKGTTDQPDEALAYQKIEITNDIRQAQTIKTELQINKEIASLPEEEIINYLEKTGTEEDLEILAATVNGNDLPEQVDYLLDDETLNNYLEELNFSEKSN